MARMSGEQKEQYASMQRQLMEKKERMLEKEPEVKRWHKRKKIILKVFAAYMVIHAVVSVIAMMQMQMHINYAAQIFTLLFQLFWLVIFINPEASWQPNIMLFVSAAFNALQAFQILNGYSQTQMAYVMKNLVRKPALGIMILMELLVPFLFLGLGCYLTLPKAHRELSERVQAINKSLQLQAQPQNIAEKAHMNTGAEDEKKI